MLKIFLRLSFFIGAMFSAASVFAQYGLTEARAGLPDGSIQGKIGTLLGAVLGFTGTIFFVLVVYAGLMWMTAAGNEERTEKAKKILTTAIIGLIIVLSAYAITSFIGRSIG